MERERHFLKVGECHWVNAFEGSVVYAEIKQDADGKDVLDIHFTGGQMLRWYCHTVEAKLFTRWLDGQSVDLEKKYQHEDKDAAWVNGGPDENPYLLTGEELKRTEEFYRHK